MGNHIGCLKNDKQKEEPEKIQKIKDISETIQAFSVKMESFEKILQENMSFLTRIHQKYLLLEEIINFKPNYSLSEQSSGEKIMKISKQIKKKVKHSQTLQNARNNLKEAKIFINLEKITPDNSYIFDLEVSENNNC